MAPLATDGVSPPCKIRRADQSDLAAVQGISAEAYIAAYVPALGYIPLPAEEDYGPRIERGEVWLLACGDGDVGVAVLEEHRDHLLVYSVAVRPTEQGKGHGGALLDFADQRAAALGLAVIRLYTNVRMEKNIALYRRHGYAEIGSRPHPSRVVKCSSTWCAPCRRALLERLLSTRGLIGDC
jgi:ribosomal protein S18 acetylase RimI-like enzyme